MGEKCQTNPMHLFHPGAPFNGCLSLIQAHFQTWSQTQGKVIFENGELNCKWEEGSVTVLFTHMPHLIVKLILQPPHPSSYVNYGTSRFEQCDKSEFLPQIKLANFCLYKARIILLGSPVLMQHQTTPPTAPKDPSTHLKSCFSGILKTVSGWKKTES